MNTNHKGCRSQPPHLKQPPRKVGPESRSGAWGPVEALPIQSRRKIGGRRDPETTAVPRQKHATGKEDENVIPRAGRRSAAPLPPPQVVDPETGLWASATDMWEKEAASGGGGGGARRGFAVAAVPLRRGSEIPIIGSHLKGGERG